MEMNNMNETTDELQADGNTAVEVKRPKRVLHFSDGIMEEFDDSDDEVDAHPQKKGSVQAIESELQWGPWLFHKATKAGTTFLSGCDYVGESLASALGITTPKYQSEIAEYKRIQAENEKIQREKVEHASWTETENKSDEVIINDVTAATNGKYKF